MHDPCCSPNDQLTMHHHTLIINSSANLYVTGLSPTCYQLHEYPFGNKLNTLSHSSFCRL